MSLQKISSDFDALPIGLLEEAKQQMRVEFDRDDDFITGCIARAISEVEAVTNLSIAPEVWKWVPNGDICNNNGVLVPKWFVSAVTHVDSSGTETDVEMTVDGTKAYIPQALTVSGYYILETGFETRSLVPPIIVSPILQLAATFYEVRESLQFGSLHEIPDMTRRLLSGLWRPSV